MSSKAQNLFNNSVGVAGADCTNGKLYIEMHGAELVDLHAGCEHFSFQRGVCFCNRSGVLYVSPRIWHGKMGLAVEPTMGDWETVLAAVRQVWREHGGWCPTHVCFVYPVVEKFHGLHQDGLTIPKGRTDAKRYKW